MAISWSQAGHLHAVPVQGRSSGVYTSGTARVASVLLFCSKFSLYKLDSIVVTAAASRNQHLNAKRGITHGSN